MVQAFRLCHSLVLFILISSQMATPEMYCSAVSQFHDLSKGKGKCIYIALISVVHVRCSGMDHAVLPAITPMPASTS